MTRNRLMDLLIRYPVTATYLLLCMAAVVLVLSVEIR